MIEREERKPKLTVQQLSDTLVHAIRVPELFALAKQHLTSANIGSNLNETQFGLVWDAALRVAERNGGKLPTKGQDIIVMSEVLSMIEEAGNSLPPEVARDCEAYTEWVYKWPEDSLNVEYYRRMLQDLIVERAVYSNLAKEISAATIKKPVDILKSLAEYGKQVMSLMSSGKKLGTSAFPKDFKPQKLGKISTGISYFNDFMNGGAAAGEVYVLLGPTGLGKTTSGVMLTCEAAKQWLTIYKNGGCPRKKVSCFFSWEQDKARLQLRFWSYAAKIESSRLEEYAEEMTTLSTTGNLQEYELRDFAKEIAKTGLDNFPGEQERYNAAIADLGDVVEIFDFSGADPDNPRQGEGLIDEVAMALEQVVKSGYDIGVVVLDYAGAAVKRHIASINGKPENMRHYLGNFCNECRYKIAVPFNCPVWVFHQLNTESNRKAPTAEQHHSYASESGNFAENAWFAFVFGTKDRANNTTKLQCTKERRAKGDVLPKILKIEGQYCRMVDVTDTYTVDEVAKQLIPRDLAARRAAATGGKRSKNDIAEARKSNESRRADQGELDKV